MTTSLRFVSRLEQIRAVGWLLTRGREGPTSLLTRFKRTSSRSKEEGGRFEELPTLVVAAQPEKKLTTSELRAKPDPCAASPPAGTGQKIKYAERTRGAR